MATTAPMTAFNQGFVKYPKGQGFGVSLNGKWYRLAANRDSPLRIGTRDSLAERLDQRGSSDENVLDLGYAFSRSNLTGGEGLDWFPRVSQLGQPDPLDLIRYWDASNLSIDRPDAGQPYSVTLSHDVRTFYTPTTPPIDMATSGDFIYIAWGTQVDWFASWDNAIPEGTFNFGVGVSLVVSGPGDDVFVLTVDGHLWFKPWGSALFVEVYDLTGEGFNDRPLTNIWLVKGRLVAERIDVASQSGTIELVEGTPVGVGDPTDPTWMIEFIQLDSASGRFRRVIDAGIAIVAIVSDGSVRSYVPQSDTGGGDPSLTIRGSTTIAVGETPLSIGWGNGIVILLTTSDEEESATQHTIRAYQSQVLDERNDFIVGNLQLLRTWHNAAEPPSTTKNMPASRDHIFWTVEEEAGNDYLWSFDVVTTGLHRISEAGADISALVIFDSLNGAILGDSVIVTDLDRYKPGGYLILPNINFGLNTELNWVNAVLEAQGLDGTTGVTMFYSTDPRAVTDPDDPSWTLLTMVRHDSQQGIEIAMSNVTSKSLALKIELLPSGNRNKTPVVTRIAVRAFPQHRDWIVELPINVSDMISAPGRMPYRLANYGDTVHRSLLGMSGNAVECVVLDPPFVIRGVIDTILEPVEYVSHRGSVGRYAMVRIRGTKIETSGTAAGTNQGLGIAQLGTAGLGIESTIIDA